MIRFLHAADLHLDSPQRGLQRYQGAPLERLRRATREALVALVDLALEREVQLLLLAGDIYDGDWTDFNTGLFFREQLVRLTRAGIRVFLVQGNHDARSVISRQLSMPEGVWVFDSDTAQTQVVEHLGVAVHGRSFPDRAVDEDLVPGYPAPRSGLFNIGLLHTSLAGDAAHDTYAPTSVEALIDKGYDYWALGHIHTRQVVREAAPRILFPGNLQGRHARETGPRGCELVEVHADRVTSEFIALDRVRWHRLELDLNGVDQPKELQQALQRALDEQIEADDQRLHALRIELHGASELQGLEASQPGQLEALLRAQVQDDVRALWIEQVRLRLRWPQSRQQLRDGGDALGELAGRIESLAGDSERLGERVGAELDALLSKLPQDLGQSLRRELTDPQLLEQLLNDAEASILARLHDETASR